MSATPDGWATEFTSGLLDIDFAHQSCGALGAWLVAEEAPDLLPGIPSAFSNRALYVSLLEPAIIGQPSPVPSPGQWRARRGGRSPMVGERPRGSARPAVATDDRRRLATARHPRRGRGRLGSADDHKEESLDDEALLPGDPGRLGALAGRIRDRARLGLDGVLEMTCEWYNPATYGQCAGDAAKAAAGDAFNAIAESFGQAADHAVSWLWGQMSAATAVHLGGAGFNLELGITAAIAGVVAVGLFAIQIIQSVLRREAGGLARALKGLVVAFIGGGAAIAVVNLLLGATDDLCAGIVQAATGTDITGLGQLVLGTGALTGAVGGSAALLLLSLACIVATVIVYFALVVRKVLIVVTAIFAPLAFAGSLADITVSWTRRWIETTVALIVSKLILILIFIAGYGILIEGVGQAGSGTTQKVTQVISGVLVLFLAGFAPWSALKIVHFTGEHAHQIHSLGSSTVAGAATGGRMAQKAAPYFSRLAVPAAAGTAAGSALVGGSAASSGPLSGTGGNGTARGPGGQGGSDGGAGTAGGGAAQGGAGTPPPSAAPSPGPQPSRTSPARGTRTGMPSGSSSAGSTP